MNMSSSAFFLKYIYFLNFVQIHHLTSINNNRLECYKISSLFIYSVTGMKGTQQIKYFYLLFENSFMKFKYTSLLLKIFTNLIQNIGDVGTSNLLCTRSCMSGVHIISPGFMPVSAAAPPPPTSTFSCGVQQTLRGLPSSQRG